MLSKFAGNLVAKGGGSHAIIRPCMKPDTYLVQGRALTTTALNSQKDDTSGKRNLQTQPVQSPRTFVPPPKSGTEGTEELVQVQGLQGEPVHDFSPPWARDVMSQALNETPAARFDNVNQGAGRESFGDHARPQEMVSPDSYQHTSHVSLYSVMQSNVPHPYSKGPTHLNMPSGGHAQNQKYIAAMMKDTHPSRNFSTSSRHQAVPNQKFVHKSVLDSEPVAPQGVQGYECDRFKLWVDNCHRYQLGSCEEQIQGLATGRKTLAQVFEEQDELIAQIAKDYQQQQAKAKDTVLLRVEEYDEGDMQGLQSGVPPRRPQVLPEDNAPTVQGTQSAHVSEWLPVENSACPQGVQGSDCENFKLWLQNCMKYGFADCENQLVNLKSGRKSLNEIFTEQDNLIREIAEKYEKKDSIEEERP